jgi:uncharacterized damage-inducible protein DinB
VPEHAGDAARLQKEDLRSPDEEVREKAIAELFRADERTILEGLLEFQRGALLRKAEGLSDEDLRRPRVPSGTSILGLVKHLAAMERTWFRNCFAGEGVEELWREDDPEADLRIEPDETADGIIALYRDEVDAAKRSVANASLDDLGRKNGLFSLRFIYVHMIEETARHNGHVDILREQIDGVTGQ